MGSLLGCIIPMTIMKMVQIASLLGTQIMIGVWQCNLTV